MKLFFATILLPVLFLTGISSASAYTDFRGISLSMSPARTTALLPTQGKGTVYLSEFEVILADDGSIASVITYCGKGGTELITIYDRYLHYPKCG